MMKIRYSMIAVILLILFALMFTACTDGETSRQSEAETGTQMIGAAETVTETEELQPIETPQLDEGIITYSSGGVFILEDNEWWEAEIGELISQEDSLKTEAASYCEIQFGETAVVRIQENTEITIKSLTLRAEEANIGLAMKSGGILCKVQKLAGSEKFKVETQTAVCGVRGTEFSVSGGPGRETKLAVKEGAVAVLPASMDVEGLKAKTVGKGDEVARLLDEIERSAPLVEADQEIDIDESLLEETEDTVKDVVEAVEEIAAAETSEDIETKVKNLAEAVERTKQEVSQRVEPPKRITEETRKSLEEIDTIRMLEIPPESGETGAETAQPALVRLAVRAEPRDAVIELNGEGVGAGQFSGIYPEGTDLKFRITAPGYREHTLDIVTGADTSKAYTVKLGKLPVSKTEDKTSMETAAKTAPEDTPEEPVEPEKEPEKEPIEVKVVPERVEVETITVKTTPRDAVITVNGRPAGTGGYSGQYEAGTEISVSVERRGYESQDFTIRVGKDEAEQTVTLVPKTVQTDEKITSGGVVGSVVTSGGRIFTADGTGRLVASNPDGEVLWSVETANTPNENSYPVVSGNTVYFSGSKELVIVNAVDGKVTARVPLEGSSAHLFGRRVVPYGSDILFPTNDGIQVRDGRSGAVKREIPLPRGSRMSPGLWNDSIVITDQQGSLLLIDAETGTVEGDVASSAVQPVALGVTVYDDMAFFSGRKGTVVCVDLAARKLLWERKLPGGAPVFTDLQCDGDGIYAFSKGTLFILSIEDGGDRFPPVQGATSCAVCGGDRFYYGAGSALAAADSRSGRELRRIPAAGVIAARPALEGTRVFAGTENGRILVINP